MKTISRLLLLAALSQALPINIAWSGNDNTLVPLEKIEAPAIDLIYNSKAIDQDEAVSLRKKGLDLSLFEPSPNDSWGKSLELPQELPEEEATLDYDSSLAGFGHEISIHRVLQGSKAYRLSLSTVPHRALLTRALLSHLGYNQYPLKRYKQLTIRFSSLEERGRFLDTVTLDTVKDSATWILSEPNDTPTLTLQDIVLEPGRTDLRNFYWAYLPSDFSGGLRALRALLAPIALCDAPENIDSYSWDFDRIQNNALLINYPHEVENQRPFDDSTIDDIRWIARKIASISLTEWQQIVREADYPKDIGELVLQKILARRNQMLASLKISSPALPYDPHFSNPSVQNGQVIQAKFPSYASRFSYGDSEDPMSFSEMLNYSFMAGISSGMNSLAGLLNQKMVVANTDPYAQKHQQEVINDFVKHTILHPDQPYSQPISTWGGPIGGFNLNANRQITSGSFYGSDATIQLVDTLGFSGNIGYFLGIDGIKNIIPSLQANASFNRNYTHLRSLKSIKEAVAVPALDFIIPSLLNDLSQILAKPKPEASISEKSEALANYTQAVEDLLVHIRDGELFTITDTLTTNAGAQVRIPVQVLFPTAPLGYNQSINFGANSKGTILRRTTLSRVQDPSTGDNYLQIYVQSLDSVTGSLSLDFNFWLKIIHLESNTNIGVAQSRVYTLQSDPNRSRSASLTISNSIRSLLESNADADLQKNYPYYDLHHDVNETDFQSRFLFFQGKSLEERHSLRVSPPADPDHPYRPADFERSFYSYRKLDLSGTNFMSVVADSVNAASTGIVQISNNPGDNPAHTLYGSSHWNEFYTDAELTEGAKYSPVSIYRETWAGWQIAQHELFRIFDTIDRKLADFKGLVISPIHRDIFASTSILEFYTIRATTIFYENGMNRILSALDPAPIPGAYQPDWFQNFFKDEYSATDKLALDQIIHWLGGKNTYAQICLAEENKKQKNRHQPPLERPDPVNWKGNVYPCLDPWAMDVLALRRGKPNKDKKAYLEWQTKMLALLEAKIPAFALLKAAGSDGFFFQISIGGFRQGDHQAKNSEQNEIIGTYLSDSIGTANQFAGAGALSDLANKTKILPYEINAQFFSGGD